MKNALSLACVLTSTSVLFACASVPGVESRLQSMQFYPNMYVVQAGESINSIAFRYRLTPAELLALNPGIDTSFRIGMRINVREGTDLASDVRARATTGYELVQQPRIISESERRDIARSQQQVQQQAIQQAPQQARNNQSIANSQPVIEAPSVVAVPSGVSEPQPMITEIPASSWSSEKVVVADGTFTEEVIPDTLDYSPVEGARASMDRELQSYVGQWAWPTEGQVAREFAPNEVGGQGVDIAGVPGQDIRAAMAGTVVYSGRDLSGGGNLIIVRHDDALMTTYSHADQLFVAEDDQVAAGDPIASLGWNSDRESVLRFEVRENGNPLNPMNFLQNQ